MAAPTAPGQYDGAIPMHCNESCALLWYPTSVPDDVSLCEEGGTMVATVRKDDSAPANFAYESELVAAAIKVMAAGLDEWGVVEFRLEFDYRCGRTDIVAVSGNGSVIAIEAKLRDWRRALQQAYGNTAFASESYVLMPLVAIPRVLTHAIEFSRRGVGICVIEGECLRVVHPARRHAEPLLPALNQRAAAFAAAGA
jgi:hypothetical protein